MSSPDASSDGRSEPSVPEVVAPQSFLLHGVLFVLTVASVFATGAALTEPKAGATWYEQWWLGWTYAVPLMLILVVHEGGHYVASRLHRVPASLPYFIPFPHFSPFGTMGAVIVMRGRIRSAKALLDIGAAGPLAGMLVAIPTMIVGLKASEVLPRATTGYVQEGQSLLYVALKWLVLGPIPSTHDVYLHPTAFAAWAGFFVTFLNLLPFAQLDGGHVAFALFGHRHDSWSRRMWLVPLGALVYNALTVAWPAIVKAWAMGFEHLTDVEMFPAISSTSSWILLTLIVFVVTRKSGGVHPPVDEPGLDSRRKAIAVFTLLLFVLLFMPAPFVQY
jgi:membrane-associated protease RseP (regulator of RpoE activity)